jgi:hypothetical protein
MGQIKTKTLLIVRRDGHGGSPGRGTGILTGMAETAHIHPVDGTQAQPMVWELYIVSMRLLAHGSL